MELYKGEGIYEDRLSLSFYTIYSFISVAFCGSHERRLLNDLNLNYNKLERPVAEESDALEIKFGLTLQQILDVVSLKSDTIH